MVRFTILLSSQMGWKERKRRINFGIILFYIYCNLPICPSIGRGDLNPNIGMVRNGRVIISPKYFCYSFLVNVYWYLWDVNDQNDYLQKFWNIILTNFFFFFFVCFESFEASSQVYQQVRIFLIQKIWQHFSHLLSWQVFTRFHFYLILIFCHINRCQIFYFSKLFHTNWIEILGIALFLKKRKRKKEKVLHLMQ